MPTIPTALEAVREAAVRRGRNCPDRTPPWHGSSSYGAAESRTPRGHACCVLADRSAAVHVRITSVAKKSNGPSPTLLDSGWRGLQEGRWDEARARFEQAVGAEETPEGFEGLSWAAWWLDDAETVFAARERAYHLYKDAGDGAGAARMAIWLACDQLDFHGAFAVAGGWLGRAQRLLEPLEPGPSTVGLPSSRASSRTLVARPQRLRSLGAARPRSGRGTTCPTWRCSVSRSRARCWWRARTCRRACAASMRPP